MPETLHNTIDGKPLPAAPSRAQETVDKTLFRFAQIRHAILVAILPAVGFVVAMVALALGAPVGGLEIGLLAGMWFVTAMGMTVGFHRHFTHRSFKTPRVVRVALIIAGSMAGQGPLTYWVALHRRHHECADRPGDPHSPHLQPEGRWQGLRGLWHSHYGWLFDHDIPNTTRYAPDIIRDPLLSGVGRLYFLWFTLGLAIPALVGGIVYGTAYGALSCFLWGSMVRLFLVQNLIWTITSIAHIHGNRPYRSSDMSVNNAWLALPTVGESWHNNHHAFSNSAYFGLEWWQVDLGGYFIRALRLLGLAWDVRVPTERHKERKRIDSAVGAEPAQVSGSHS